MINLSNFIFLDKFSNEWLFSYITFHYYSIEILGNMLVAPCRQVDDVLFAVFLLEGGDELDADLIECCC